MVTHATTSTNAQPEVTTVTQKQTARTRLVSSAVLVGRDSRAMESGVKVGPCILMEFSTLIGGVNKFTEFCESSDT